MKRSETKNDNEMTDQEKVDLWFSFLFSGLAMLNSDTLDLESSSQNRKKVVLEQAGDIRDEIYDKIRDVWSALGNRKYSMISKLVEPLLRLADLQYEKTKALSTDMYLSLFSSELKLSNNFTLIRFVTINAVDLVVTERSRLRHSPTHAGLNSLRQLDLTKDSVSKPFNDASNNEAKDKAPGQGFEELFDIRLRKKFQNDPLLNTGETLDFYQKL